MVLASAKHPAMLVYLDNFQSIGPSSPAARRGQRHGARRGLNENYARELLELHTLGVNGGYTQSDVQELARILTGWTIEGLGARPATPGRGTVRRERPEPGSPIGFAFQDMLHEPGTKTVLNERYKEDGVAEGERAIRALCRHPSTARFLATKLAAHFVSDAPPAAAVDRIARAFLTSDGNLKVVARALVDEPEAWSETSRKFRTPQDWFVAVLRAFGSTDVSRNALFVLRQLRHPLWSPPSPKGFGDGMQDWADPDALLNRGELARTVSRLPSVAALDPRSLLDVVDVPADNSAHTVIARRLDPSHRADCPRHRRSGVSVEVTMNRREFVRHMCYGGIATCALPSVSFAQVKQPGRLVFVLLRGGFDGLAAVVPYGDPDYRTVRGAFAFDQSELTPFDDTFGLAPGLSPLRALWDSNELAVLHAMAIPHRTRSHFDGQAILETGLDRPAGSSDGWLNRLLQVMSGRRSGIAIAAGMPLSLTGTYEVESWSPTRLGVVDDGFLERLAVLYRTDAALHGRFEAALQQSELVGEEPMARGNARRGGTTSLMQAAARILRQEEGPNIAAMEFSGWDTHANQGTAGGALDRLLGELAQGLVAFRAEMGAAWQTTTVVVMTEFGRTVRPNGTRGTDHGTAGAGFVLGPRLSRSQVVSDWPGLGQSALYEARDLKPTLDTRSILKAALAGTFDLTNAQLERVFPNSTGCPRFGWIDDLTRRLRLNTRAPRMRRATEPRTAGLATAQSSRRAIRSARFGART